ncbi:MAG: aldo/keto reductase, partial [Clostridia bacterium]|nr:aldo/keto reductase [Clostridia bacterium]
YRPEQAAVAIKTLRELGTPCLIHQPNYSMFDRWIEDGLTDVLRENGVGCICFAPLQNGLLTNRYINGIPADSRAAHDPRYLKPDAITAEKIEKVRALSEIAKQRGQALSQMALAWVLRDPVVTSALIGASRPEQIIENVKALDAAPFTAEELAAIDAILAK